MEDHVEPVVAVVGATATGKSALGIALARELGGEIVSADAFQLYRGMDIGTAKVTAAERALVPHHQLDVLDLQDEATVAGYQAAARADLAAIRARGARPMLVGGSGLYVRAALDVLDIPPTDPGVRARLEAEAAEHGIGVLRERLRGADPAADAAIDGPNERRVIRALEVIELTGRPFSATMPKREHVQPTVVIGLRTERAALDRRVDERVERMWADGMLAEVALLEEQGLSRARTASRAVGYPQALAQLRGELTEAEAIAATQQATRRLVRRQESWFGADPRIVWLDPARPDLLDAALTVVRHA